MDNNAQRAVTRNANDNVLTMEVVGQESIQHLTGVCRVSKNQRIKLKKRIRKAEGVHLKIDLLIVAYSSQTIDDSPNVSSWSSSSYII
jgi:hypothetical protein